MFARLVPYRTHIGIRPRAEQPAELLFKIAQLVNVLSGEVHPAHLAVDDGRIVGLGDYEAERVIDLGGHVARHAQARRR